MERPTHHPNHTMKIQIDLDPELWNRFRDVVIAKGQTLKEVVPTVFEPALRWYLHDPPKIGLVENPKVIESEVNMSLPVEDSPQSEEAISRTINPPYPPVKRCDLCDMPTERTFNHKGRKVCYVCWRDGIINEGTKQEPEQV